MSAQPAFHDVPPPGAPAHWAHMPWRARQQWFARQAKAKREQAPGRDDGRLRDEQGRLIWTEEEQRAANRIVDRWRRTGAGPTPTADQLDACRAYRRAKGERRRREAGSPPRDSDKDRAKRSRTAKARHAYHRFGRGTSTAPLPPSE